jgi:excisionase family DNA binding protein
VEPQSDPVAAGDDHPVDHLHTPDYVAQVLGHSVEHVRRLIASGEIESYRLGHRSIRVSDAQLERFLASREVAS